MIGGWVGGWVGWQGDQHAALEAMPVAVVSCI